MRFAPLAGASESAYAARVAAVIILLKFWLIMAVLGGALWIMSKLKLPTLSHRAGLAVIVALIFGLVVLNVATGGGFAGYHSRGE